MNAAPWVTVAIPTYNGARHVGQAVRSVLAQTEHGFELIVVDDRSEDQTLAVVREIAGDRARIEVNSERLGLAGNWNRCVALSRTPWVAIFHQDDVWAPEHLTRQRSFLSEHPQTGLVFGRFDVIDDQGRALGPRTVERVDLGPTRPFGPGEFVAELRVRNPVRCSTATLSRAAHESIGGFDARRRYVVDWEFWFRVAQQYSVGWVHDASVNVRWHAESETHRFRAGTEDLDEVASLLSRIQAWGPGERSDSPQARRDADRAIARAYLNRAYDAARAGNGTLAARALRVAREHDPAIARLLLRDPRMAMRLARYWFGKPAHS